MAKKVVFKRYEQNQPMLLPLSYEELVPENHPVRVVNEVLERIDIRELMATYKGGGASSYHPRMLLKVVVYAYLRNMYSSRKIEEALKENVHFMWLAGGAKPDHNTISDFRSKRLGSHLKKIFNQVVALLSEQGAITLKEIVLDGQRSRRTRTGTPRPPFPANTRPRYRSCPSRPRRKHKDIHS